MERIEKSHGKESGYRVLGNYNTIYHKYKREGEVKRLKRVGDWWQGWGQEEGDPKFIKRPSCRSTIEGLQCLLRWQGIYSPVTAPCLTFQIQLPDALPYIRLNIVSFIRYPEKVLSTTFPSSYLNVSFLIKEHCWDNPEILYLSLNFKSLFWVKRIME